MTNSKVLEALSKEFAQLSLHEKNISELLTQLTSKQDSSLSTMSSTDVDHLASALIDVQLFNAFIKIYRNAEEHRVQQNNRRKGARQVSVSISETVIAKFSQLFGSKFTFTRDGKYIIVSLNQKPFALLRIGVDLGFSRGEDWRTSLEADVKKAKTLNLTTDHLFVIILSCINSFKDTDIKQKLGKSIHKSDLLLLENRSKLVKYLKSYKESFDSLTPGLSDQLFFESATNHPNIDGTNFYQDPSFTFPNSSIIFEHGFKKICELLTSI